MKKRKFISIALTILVIVVTFNYWLISRPLTFSMDIKSQSENPIIITTVLNRKDDPSFSKSYENESEINLQKTKKYNISFRQKTPPKRLRLILNQIEPHVEYQISNLSFRDGKYRINDLSKFKSKNAKLKINDNSLVIIPNSDTATLDYSERITAKQAKKFDLKIFLIIGTLSFLLFLKLTSYLADFKINKNASRLDIIFLAICAALLFIPMFNINQEVKSEQENRNLAEWKTLFNKDNSINLNFGKDYESWISDRFGMRKLLINLYQGFSYNIASRYYKTSKAYLDKKTNWEFSLPIISESLTSEQIEKSADGLIGFDNFCKKNNIKLYLLVVPKKEYIYMQETFLSQNNTDNYKEPVEKIKEKTSIPVIYPFKELKEASKENYVFFKTDPHWTDFGAYTGYKALIKEMKKDYPYLKEVRQDDFNVSQNNLIRSDWGRDFYRGHTNCFLINLPEKKALKILDTKYNYYTHKDEKNMKKTVIDVSKLKKKSFKYEKVADLKVLMTGTSMNEDLTEILPYTFKNTIYFRLNGVKDIPISEEFKILKRLKKDILDYKPDIIVLCITVGNLRALKNLASED
ncbi:MAG: hypothetical protein LUG16_07005 [Candidatus Gastranaerophilales bacterium]|nr:hypothetical protein [Candidatus Gastranaerophilales bacterium]